MKSHRAFCVIVAGTLLSFALPDIASGSANKPVISDFTVTPTSLPTGGGQVVATATVKKAGKDCYFELHSNARDFGGLSKVSAGSCSYSFLVPANELVTTMYAVLTITVPGSAKSGASAEQQVTLSVAPSISDATSTTAAPTTFPKTSGNTIKVKGVPNAILVAGQNVWVASCNSNAVTEIDATTHQVVQELFGAPYGFVCPRALALVGNDIWVANFSNNSITVVSASTGSFLQILAGPGIAEPDLITATSSNVWVYSENGLSSLSEFEPSGTYVGGVHGGPAMATQCLVSTGADIWAVDSENGLVEYNARTGVYLRRSKPGALYLAGCVKYHGGILWVSTDSGSDPLKEFNALTGKALRVQANASSGNSLVLDGSALFVDTYYSPIVSIREYTPAGRFVRTLISARANPSGASYSAMAVDGKDLWVNNISGDSVRIIPIG